MQSFAEKIKELASKFPNDPELKAILLFYSNISANLILVKADSHWGDCLSVLGCILSFRVGGAERILAESPCFAEHLSSLSAGDAKDSAVCLITGKKSEIARIHTGCVLGGKSGVSIVGFQVNSGYDSYGKTQAYNAPVSKEAELCYTTALNTMLAKGSSNRCSIGDTTFIFWSEQQNEVEKVFNAFFEPPSKDDPNAGVEKIESFLKAYEAGRLSPAADGKRFYVLGMSPNVTRVMIRFWWQGTVSEISRNIAMHFEDFKIKSSRNDDRDYYPLFNILTQISNEHKLSNLPPKLYGEVIQSILNSSPYPRTLQMQCMRRIDADRVISQKRAAVLKACLNRKLRQNNNQKEKEITMALDKENKNQAYLCGRLFAVLEKIQSDSTGGVNASIKDKYYGSASTTPVAVFGRLLDLSNHHEGKLSEGAKIHYRKMIQEIVADIDAGGFPKYLSLDDQSRFAIGYYHQMQELYTPKSKQETK